MAGNLTVEQWFQFYVILNGIKTIDLDITSQPQFQFYVILNGIKTKLLDNH